MSALAALACILPARLAAQAQSLPATLPDIPWHLTARPWQAVNQPRSELMDKVEAIANNLATFQYWNPGNTSDVRNGEITDPYRGSEWQYATPYFAFAAASVLADDRSPSLLTAAIRAMDHTTADIAGLDNPAEDNGHANDDHGEFTVAPMAKAFVLFDQMRLAGKFPAELTQAKIDTWRARMAAPRASFMFLQLYHNWITYASKGEWLRAKAGLIEKTEAVAYIENNWNSYHRPRLVRDQATLGRAPYFYTWHDDDPGTRQNFAYHAGATGNLLDMVQNGYDGASRADMEAVLDYSAKSSLLLMAGSGDAPAAARTGDHVWNDIVYANLFDNAAERAFTAGNIRLAGQFRHAAMLGFRSAWRFQQEKGTFSVTKNNFHPSLAIHYADWSALTNYNGYTYIHSAESYQNRKTAIPEQPSPSEIGGYAAVLDNQFAYAFLNAGGMQTQLCTNGATLANPNNISGSMLWHTLGILRFSRPGWDSRLGPGDGWTKKDLTQAISFSPTFFEGGVWKPIALYPDRFVGAFTPEFTHPLLVRGTLAIAPRSGQTGPSFELKLTITPDGVLVDTTRTAGTEAFGMVWPLLTYDGKYVLDTAVGATTATTAFPKLSATPAIVQAEAGTLSGGIVPSTASASDARGGAYVTYPTTGGSAAWSGLHGGDGGATTLAIRYSFSSASAGTRTMVLRVNGQARTLTFDSTFDSTKSATEHLKWHQQFVPVTLNAGATNSVSLESNGFGGVNFDELRVFPAVATQTAPDQQAFLALDAAPVIDATDAPIRASYGDLRPVRVTSGTATQTTFVYPRNGDDPSAAAVQTGFTRTANGFTTPLARVNGNLYVGRTSAGGRGTGIDLDVDGNLDITFNQSCDFVIQLVDGQPSAIEADRAVIATIYGTPLALSAYAPASISSLVTADAGPDLAVADADANGIESVILDASATVVNSGSVARYRWSEGLVLLGEGAQLATSFSRGAHLVTLSVDHSSGITVTDTKLVTVNAPATAEAGPDIARTDADGDQVEAVTLNAGASVLRAGTVPRYSWWLGAVYLGAGQTLTLEFPRGVHTVTLKIEHSSGEVFTDTLTVTVNPTSTAPAGAVLYREVFGRAAAGNDVIGGAGWSAYGGATGVAITTANAGFTGDGAATSGQASASNLASFPAVNSGTTATDPANGRTFVFSESSFIFTSEFSVNRAISPVTTITWDQRGPGPALSAAVQIGGVWYASATIPNPNALNVWNTASVDLATTTWRFLNFTENSVLGLGATTTLPAGGTITAFGLYCASGGSGGMRVDGYTINGLADTNGLADAWEIHHFGAPGQNAAADPNGDGVPLGDDFIVGNDPAGPNAPLLRFLQTPPDPLSVVLDARAAFGPGYTGKVRKFQIFTSTTLLSDDWQTVPGYESVNGDNLAHTVAVPVGESRRFYRAKVWLE